MVHGARPGQPWTIDPQGPARRQGGLLVNRKYVDQRQTDSLSMTVLELFQFMAGNVDWPVPALHNIKLFFSAAFPNPVAIPYDFDLCGLVDPPYLAGEASRTFRGLARAPATWRQAIARFLDKKEAILDLYRNHPYLQPRQRAECLDYLTAFFTLLEQPEEDVLNSLGEACRKQ